MSDIIRATYDSIAVLTDMKGGSGDEAYFRQCLAMQEEGARDIYITQDKITQDKNGAASGYVIFNRRPRYALYQRLEIPEIQDLAVRPSCRRQGIGTALILLCEQRARAESYDAIGISVGLHSGFGAAQRLYARLGYVPDGYGVTYDRATVAAGEIRPVDDDLCLMMVKDL